MPIYYFLNSFYDLCKYKPIENPLQKLTVNYFNMKTYKIPIFVGFYFLVVNQMFAQENVTKKEGSDEIQTVFSKRYVSNGWYWGFSVGYTYIAGQYALTTGFRGGWIANHMFVPGIAGTTFISQEIQNQLLLINNYLTGGYGGLLIEPILFPQKPLHISFPMIFGALA
jgi:hypothetical protein